MLHRFHQCHCERGHAHPGKDAARKLERCSEVCRRILAQMANFKASVARKQRNLLLKAHHRMVGLALNEAEALAWQTVYPHLVFPELAKEKVRNVVAWTHRQKRVRTMRPEAMFGTQG